MRKLLIILSLLVWSDRVANPEETATFVIFGTEPIKPYEKVWEAICEVESRKNPMAYNKKEESVGICQIREIRLRDYEQQTGVHYELNEMFDVEKSKSVFMHYASQINPSDIEKIAREWNGGANGMKKRSTKKYYELVKKALNP